MQASVGVEELAALDAKRVVGEGHFGIEERLRLVLNQVVDLVVEGLVHGTSGVASHSREVDEVPCGRAEVSSRAPS